MRIMGNGHAPCWRVAQLKWLPYHIYNRVPITWLLRSRETKDMKKQKKTKERIWFPQVDMLVIYITRSWNIMHCVPTFTSKLWESSSKWASSSCQIRMSYCAGMLYVPVVFTFQQRFQNEILLELMTSSINYSF
jgi:hypothetical protein